MATHTSALTSLFEENILAKILHTAQESLTDNNPPASYPEYVPQTGDHAGRYILREADFWTCGFFPGCIYSLLERLIRHPSRIPASVDKRRLQEQLQTLGETWSQPLKAMAHRTDTHDMSFMIQPAMRVKWEVFHDTTALDAIITAAKSLFTRYNEHLGAIRSWDVLTQRGVNITSIEEDFLVIIDSMCNLDLLFYAAAAAQLPELAAAAHKHASSIRSHHLRVEQPLDAEQGPWYSSFHVVNFHPTLGVVKDKRTAQGYAASSTWARGQAWGILGFAQSYVWTKDPVFLDAAMGLTNYFWHRLENAPACVRSRPSGRLVPLWDFDAPIEEAGLRDSSAGVIAANGMLILSQALAGLGRTERSAHYLGMANAIVNDTLTFSLSQEKLRLVDNDRGEISAIPIDGAYRFDAILKNATANKNANDYKQYWDHGLVYADYYLIEYGNRLLKFGLE